MAGDEELLLIVFYLSRLQCCGPFRIDSAEFHCLAE